MKKGTIKIFIWGEGWCDNVFDIMDSNGFSLDTLMEINEELKNNDWDEFCEKSLTIKPEYIEAQVGDYPSPNIESPAHWEFKILEVKDIEHGN